MPRPLKIALPMEIIDGPEMTGCQYYAYHLAHELTGYKGLDLGLIASDRTPLEYLPQGADVFIHRPFRVMGTAFFDSLVHPPPKLDSFDLIHCPTVIAPFFFRPKAKVVFTVHDLVPLVHPRFSPLRRRLYFRYLVGRRLAGADMIIADSLATKRDILDIFGFPEGRIRVVSPGVDQAFKPGREPREDFILSVATLEPRKNLAGVVGAFIRMKEATGKATRLYLIGRMGWPGSPPLSIPERFKDQIRLLGYVSRETLIDLYQRARALVYPSFYEGFGLPILEAMACGCPVITSDRGSLPEVGGEACLYVDPESEKMIMEKLIDVLGCDGTARELTEAGLKRASAFTWDECARRTVSVYLEALGPSDFTTLDQG